MDIGPRVLNENDVCEAVAGWLAAQGFPDIAWVKAGQQGFDIACSAKSDHPGWIIEAKGAISTRPSDRSREYGSGSVYSAVSQAFTAAVSWEEHPRRAGRRIAFAIPKNRWFDIHSEKLEGACRKLGITIFRVDVNGNVFVSSPE